MTCRRAWIALLIFTLVIINYIDRVALSVAAKPIASEFGLSPIQMGYLFSSFLWTYVVCLVPIGILVERTGTKWMVGVGIALWSLATACTAATGGFLSLLAARLTMGASEATSFPAGGRIIRDWFPERERGLVTTLFNGGSTAGPAIGALLAATLVSLFSWRTTFVLLGALGFVWLLAWMIWFRQPENARWLSEAERTRILAERNGAGQETKAEAAAPSSIRYLLSQRTIWGLVITQACAVYTAYLFLTWMPTYLQSTQQMSIMGAGIFTAIPYLCTVVLGLAIARGSDRALSSEAVRAGGRRVFIAAMMVLSLMILVAPHISSVWQLMVVLTLVLTGSTTAAGLNFTLANDLLQNPRDASRVISIVAFGGNSFGLIAPIITGYIVAGTGGYTGAFIVAACLLACGAAATLLLTRQRVIPAPTSLHLAPQTL
jgi:ACS family glucarate transporter-like MFS transporter